MVIRTFFDKGNTIVKSTFINTGLNPVAELFYGGSGNDNKYSRYIFHFDETKLKSLYTGGTFPDITKLKHTLKMTNTGAFDSGLLNGTMGTKDRATSFDLIVFKVNQNWDEGVGYDIDACNITATDCATSINPSNWVNPQTGIYWSNGGGVYSGSPSGITIATQHFDAGNENLELDITNYVNGVLTGNTNYGLGLAYSYSFEQIQTSTLQYVGFFTRHTQTYYEPYIETTYNNHITDDRNNFYLDKLNKLYLYSNLGGEPTNLDTKPAANVYLPNGTLLSAYTPSNVNHVTKGVYSIDLKVSSNLAEEGYLCSDVWTGVTINGVTRPNITLNFELMDSFNYYNIGANDVQPKKVAVSISGLKQQDKINRGDVKRVTVSTRIPYTVEQTQRIDSLKYRLYVKEGKSEVTVIDNEPIEMATNYNYFLLDTASLIPNTYFIDVLAESNLEITTLKNVINFDIVSQSNYRISQ
jgi:hypothetical protein